MKRRPTSTKPPLSLHSASTKSKNKELPFFLRTEYSQQSTLQAKYFSRAILSDHFTSFLIFLFVLAHSFLLHSASNFHVLTLWSCTNHSATFPIPYRTRRKRDEISQQLSITRTKWKSQDSRRNFSKLEQTIDCRTTVLQDRPCTLNKHGENQKTPSNSSR